MVVSFKEQADAARRAREEEEKRRRKYEYANPTYECGVGDYGTFCAYGGGAYANTYITGLCRVDEIDDKPVQLNGFTPGYVSLHAKVTVFGAKASKWDYDVSRVPSERNFFLEWGNVTPVSRIVALRHIDKVAESDLPLQIDNTATTTFGEVG